METIDDQFMLTDFAKMFRVSCLFVSCICQPSDIILPSGKQYQLVSDSSYNLRSVISPSRSRFEFGRFLSLGVDRDIYRFPTFSTLSSSSSSLSNISSLGFFAVDYDSLGRPTMTRYPSGYRRIVRRYGSLGELRTIAFDRTNFDYRYDPDSMKLTQIRTVDVPSGDIIFSLEYGDPHDALITSHNVTAPRGFSSATFRYSHDEFLRVSAVDALVGDVKLPLVLTERQKETGRLDRMSGFAFRRGSTRNGQRTVTRDENIEISREMDISGRQTDVSYTFNNYVVFSLEVSTFHACWLLIV